MDIEMQLKLNICPLVNTGKQSWQKEKEKKEWKEKRSLNTANWDLAPEAAIWHSSYGTRVYVGTEVS